MSWNWVDIVIVLLAVGAGISGWRSGAVVQVMTFAGLWLGLLAGVLIAPALVRHVSPAVQPWLALVILFVMAAILVSGASILAVRLRGAVLRVHLGPLDGGLGVVVAVTATLLVCWLVGSLLSSSRYLQVSRAAQGSAIVRGIDAVLPPVPSLFAKVESFLSASGFPVVFVNVPPVVTTPSELPTDAQVQAAVAIAKPSTVRITGLACGYLVSGSGFVAAPVLVVTNAHVVAGEARTGVTDAAGWHAATTVRYDPSLDIAVLQVPGLNDPVLPMAGGTVGRGTIAAALGYPGGGAFTSSPAVVSATFRAVGLDIYGTSLVTREVYELGASVLPGDSGGPLVAAGDSSVAAGTVVGVVFSRSTTDPGVGYALTTPAVVEDVRAAEASSAPVSTGACVP